MNNTLTENKKKQTGAHFTPGVLADFVAKAISEYVKTDNPEILDPACGDGELLFSISRFFPKSKLTGFDLNSDSLEITKKRTIAITENIDFLDHVLTKYSESLFDISKKYDVIIANPPYIRTQLLGSEKSQQLSKFFRLNGRVDIYYAFLEGIYRVLKSGGIAGIIVSNRFMSTKAGKIVRERIKERFDIIHVWDFGDTRLFEAAVLPAVLLLKKKTKGSSIIPKFTTIYSIKGATPEVSVENAIEAITKNGVVNFNNCNYIVKHGDLDNSDDVWKLRTEIFDTWTKVVIENTYCTFGDIGKIRVGIKTTADKIFVSNQWSEPVPELLKKLITHNEGRRFKGKNSKYQVLYTHESKNGKRKAININNYPITKKYLESHKKELEKRNYLIKAKRNWYEIWVPQQPHFWRFPKLVFPDISEKPKFWISLNEEIIQGDCYWIVAETKEKQELLWLALAVANSSFIEDFYDHNFNNKLYAGRRRFMTQYVEKFPLPNPKTKLSKEIISLAKLLYEKTGMEDTSDIEHILEKKVQMSFGL